MFLEQYYQRLFRPTKAYIVRVSSRGVFLPIEKLRLAPLLIAWKPGEDGAAHETVYKCWLPRLLQEQGIAGNFTRDGWLISDLLEQNRSSKVNEMLQLLGDVGLKWFAEQKLD
jgi:hypothetical protein